jgi:hypothetical protein
MDREPAHVREDHPQDRRGGRRLQTAVEHRAQVGRREVHPPVRGVGRGCDRGCVGRPHRGSATASAQQLRRVAQGIFQHRGVVSAKAEPPQRVHVRARLWRQNALPDPERRDDAHFFEPLERGSTRVAKLTGVGCGREISRAEPGIAVGRAHDPVEVVFACHARDEVQRLV